MSGKLLHQGHDGDSSLNGDAYTDDMSSVSHGLENKMLPTSTPIRASMMKIHAKTVAKHEDEDDDDDFFDALDQYQALTYKRSSSKGPA